MESCNSTEAESTLTVNELKETFFSLKINNKVLARMTLVLMLSEIVMIGSSNTSQQMKDFMKNNLDFKKDTPLNMQ